MVGPGGRSDELRFSLRSLAHVPHGRVWVAGYCPAWLTGVGRIPVAQSGSRYASSAANLAAASAHPNVSGEFWLFNDDFFVLAGPPDGARHRGPVADMVAGLGHGAYRAAVTATGRLLHHLGHPDPVSYELHEPMRVDKAAMGEALRAGRVMAAPLPRSLYGNLAGLGGEQVADCKVRGLHDPVPAGAWCVSTSDRSFAAGLVGRQIRGLLPEPCRYERG